MLNLKRKTIFLPLALIVAMISGLGIGPLFQVPVYAVDGCATPTVITGGGSYTLVLGDNCFKYVNAAFNRGAMWSVMNGSDSTVSNVVKWYGGRNETVTACINDSQTLNGNGAQLNNFTVAKDSGSAMYVSITANKANTVSMSIQNWQNGSGCSVAPTPIGSGPTNTPTPTNTPAPPTNTPTWTATPTNTLVGPTNTPTPTPTNTPIVTNTPTNTPVATNTPTNTPLPTNTPTDTPVGPTNTPVSGSLRVQHKQASASPTDGEIKPHLRVHNTGSTSVALSTLKIRYWYTRDTAQPQTINCDYAFVGCGNVTFTFVQITPVTGADFYLEVGFTAGAGSVAAGGNSGEIQPRFNKNDWSAYNELDDWSYAANAAFAENNKVTLYQSGALVWGSEPGGGTPLPTNTLTNTPVATNTPTNTSIGPTNTPTPTSTFTNTPVTPVATSTPTNTPSAGNQSPNTPTITEPGIEGKVVNPADVHMETGPFADPNPGQLHACTDWEIWNSALTERVWFTSCIGGLEKVHTHLGDGVFQGSHAGRTDLLPNTNYVLRVRHKDNSGDPATEWSAFAQRGFRTSAVSIGDPDNMWAFRQPGYEIQVAATGLQLPVNIAFIPNAGTAPNSPYYYVTELYGIIKVVTRDGTVLDYATGLLNFNPTGNFPGTGEQGLTGIAVEPTTKDVFVGVLYEVAGGAHYPKVVRFHSNDGGLTMATQTTILDMVGEPQGQSHQISNLSLGPDGKLYVHMGDGFDSSTAQNLSSFRGKILRLNLDGTAPTDNPLYNAGDGINARDYVYAYGLRNPFGGAWRTADNAHYEVENGPSVDRFVKVVANRNYLWDGTDGSMSNFAIYNWNPARAPVNIAFIQSQTFNGSGFPTEKMDHAFISESGPTYASGPQTLGKRIVEFVLDASGNRLTGPTPLIEYTGTGKATVVGLAAGPDGLYFSDLYKNLNFVSPIDRGANILRIQFVGVVDFSAAPTSSATAPLNVQFTNLSTVPSPTSWLWEFGDGTTSTQQNPSHTYTATGSYNVRLTVSGASGNRSTLKSGFITIGGSVNGLRGEYYDNMDLTLLKVTRTDPTVNFDWAAGSPDVSIAPDSFSVRWTGFVQPLFSQTYTFYANTDDGARLWVNGVLLVDKWVDQPVTEWSGTIALTAGQKYSIKLEYYDNGGGALAKLSWSSPSQVKQILPQSQLFVQ